MYFVKLQACGECVDSMFQTKIKSFEVLGYLFLAKHSFLVQKKNKQIIKRRTSRFLGHQSLGDTLIKEHFDDFFRL